MAFRAANSAVKAATRCLALKPTKSATESILSHTLKPQYIFPQTPRYIPPDPQVTNCEILAKILAVEPFVKETRLVEVVSSHQRKETSDNDNPILLVSRRRNGVGQVPSDAILTPLDANLLPQADIHPPFPPSPNSNVYAECCNSNGLFCYHNGEDNKLFVWNPATGEFRIFEPLPLSRGVSNLTWATQIWAEDDDNYKLMRLVAVELEGNDIKYEIELYSLKTDSWKTIPLPIVADIANDVYINGIYYTYASIEETDSSAWVDVILCFDFSREAVSYLPLPANYDTERWCELFDYKGMLSMIVFGEIYQLWVMREKGLWDRVSDFHARGVSAPLGFSRNGELLFFERSRDLQLMVFDSGTGELKHLDGFGSRPGSIELVPFSESFIKLSNSREDQITNNQA